MVNTSHTYHPSQTKLDFLLRSHKLPVEIVEQIDRKYFEAERLQKQLHENRVKYREVIKGLHANEDLQREHSRGNVVLTAADVHRMGEETSRICEELLHLEHHADVLANQYWVIEGKRPEGFNKGPYDSNGFNMHPDAYYYDGDDKLEGVKKKQYAERRKYQQHIYRD